MLVVLSEEPVAGGQKDCLKVMESPYNDGH